MEAVSRNRQISALWSWKLQQYPGIGSRSLYSGAGYWQQYPGSGSYMTTAGSSYCSSIQKLAASSGIVELVAVGILVLKAGICFLELPAVS